MNYQKQPSAEVMSKFANNSIDIDKLFNIDYYAFPETFGSTAGPGGGIGGQAFSSFTVEAYVSDQGTVYVCNNIYRFSKEEFNFSWPR